MYSHIVFIFCRSHHTFETRIFHFVRFVQLHAHMCTGLCIARACALCCLGHVSAACTHAHACRAAAGTGREDFRRSDLGTAAAVAQALSGSQKGRIHLRPAHGPRSPRCCHCCCRRYCFCYLPLLRLQRFLPPPPRGLNCPRLSQGPRHPPYSSGCQL